MDPHWVLSVTAALALHSARTHAHTQRHVSLPVYISLCPLHFALVFPLGSHGSRGKGHLVLGPCFLSGLPPAYAPNTWPSFHTSTLLGKFPQTFPVPSLSAFPF